MLINFFKFLANTFSTLYSHRYLLVLIRTINNVNDQQLQLHHALLPHNCSCRPFSFWPKFSIASLLLHHSQPHSPGPPCISSFPVHTSLQLQFWMFTAFHNSEPYEHLPQTILVHNFSSFLPIRS